MTKKKKKKGKWQTKQDQTKQDEADNDYTRWEWTAILKDDKDLHWTISSEFQSIRAYG